MWEQVFSCAPDGSDCQIELSFQLTNTNRTEQAFQFHAPGGSMTFAPDGSFMELSDNSTLNGGGRVIILHNEQMAIPSFAITNIATASNQVQLAWSSAGAVSYNLQRSASLGTPGSFQNIATNLTTRYFTDTNSLTGGAFYRVVATPSVTP